MNHIVLLVDDASLPNNDVWQEVFKSCYSVTISSERKANTDAILASVSACERYGCRSGSSEDTLGVMNIYDSWAFNDKSEYYPRFFISNAIWRREPPLELAIHQRINTLYSTVINFNNHSFEKIYSITIECLTLGLWKDYSETEKYNAIKLINIKLKEVFGVNCG